MVDLPRKADAGQRLLGRELELLHTVHRPVTAARYPFPPAPRMRPQAADVGRPTVSRVAATT